MEKEYIDKFIDNIFTDGDLFNNFLASIRAGKNTVFQNTLASAMVLDESWIYNIDNLLYSVENIIKDPKKFIKEEDYVVAIERAKRTTSKSIRHLIVNPQDIASITIDGDVTPRRVLTTELKEDLGIYENRFVASLLHRLMQFVESRYKNIKDKYHIYDLTTVGMGSEFKYGDTNFTYDLKVTLKEPPRDKVRLERDQELINKIIYIKKRIQTLLNSSFMKQMDLLKTVHAPINKTNMLMKNTDYSNCYKLWLYISSYSLVGYSMEVKEKLLPVDSDYYDDMTVLSTMSIKTLINNESIRSKVYENIEYKELKERQYKELKKIDFTPRFNDDQKAPGEDSVNEYYFQEMKSALKKASKLPSFSDSDTAKQLRLSFGRFYRTITKISNAMFLEVIDKQATLKDSIVKTPLTIAKNKYTKQVEKYNRYKLLSKLKSDELEKTLKLESQQLIKLEKLKEEYNIARDKAETKKIVAKRKKLRLEKIKAKALLVKQKADAMKAELREKERERLAKIEEEKKIKRNESQKKREIKQLERLKEKYEE